MVFQRLFKPINNKNIILKKITDNKQLLEDKSHLDFYNGQ